MKTDKRDFWKDEIKTPNWDRFKDAVEKHILYLKEQEKLDPSFRCTCRVCQYEWEFKE